MSGFGGTAERQRGADFGVVIVGVGMLFGESMRDPSFRLDIGPNIGTYYV
jgi:hypothetical protein